MKAENLAEILRLMSDYRIGLENTDFALLTAEQKADYFDMMKIERFLKAQQESVPGGTRVERVA